MVLDIKSIFSRNFINLSLNQAVNIIATLIYTPILFQTLGDENFGLIHLAFSILTLYAIFVRFGYDFNAPVKIAKIYDKQEEASYVNRIINLRVFLSLILLLTSIPIILIFVEGNLNKILIFSFTILISESLNPLFFFQGKNKILPQVILNFFSKSIYIILILLFISGSNDAYLANFFYGISISIFYIIYWITYFKKSAIRNIGFSIRKTIFSFKENFVFFTSSAFAHFSLNSALILLSLFVSDKELGRFTLAYKIVFILRMVPVFFVQSVLQQASKLFISSKEEYKVYTNRYFKFGLLITFLISILSCFFSDLIIYIFAHENINYSSNILSLMSFIPFLAMLNFKNLVFILVNDLKSILNIATFWTLIFMISSSLILCKIYGGIGLAYALLATEIFSFIIHYFLIKKND
ncbi:MAG: oligosaccharide flippase family protein [Bacteroidota bacterium]|nr:oligosaccharide flippase family protein [Bacteroidota bacterium]